jgi:hypothetical protein
LGKLRAAAVLAEKGDTEKAIAAYDAVIADKSTDLVLAEKGDTEKAIAAYDAVIADKATDPVLADLARVRLGYILVDTATPDQLREKLVQFNVDTSPWRHAVREIFGLSAYRVKDFTMANGFMDQVIKDADAPQGIKQRAQVMVQLIAPELAKK